jgi:hypothetical protein
LFVSCYALHNWGGCVTIFLFAVFSVYEQTIETTEFGVQDLGFDDWGMEYIQDLAWRNGILRNVLDCWDTRDFIGGILAGKEEGNGFRFRGLSCLNIVCIYFKAHVLLCCRRWS